MSFSTDVKNEIARADLSNNDEIISELAGMFSVNGIILKSNNIIKLRFSTENNSIARRIFSGIKKIYDYDSIVEISKNNQLRRRNVYRINVENVIANKFLEDIFIEDNPFSLLSWDIPDLLINTSSKKKAFIKGVFLGAGSISNPQKSYHLEIIAGSLDYCKNFIALLKNFNIYANIIERKENYIIYIKDSEMISDFLSLLGAFQNLFIFEEIRVVKQIKNNVNRIINFETANLDKTVEASMKQIEDIEIIKKTIGLENLPENLKIVAELRLKFPEYSLKQIGDTLIPPVSKSGINHRFKKIRSIANNLIQA